MSLVREFRRTRPIYERFTAKLEARVRELLDGKPFAYHLVESRTKTTDSFSNKIRRGSKNYSSLSDIADMSGVRIITYYHDDALAIGAMIHDKFPSHLSRYDSADDSASEFGYRSAHYLVGAPSRGDEAAEWAEFSGMWGEIQVRTVLQHAWAAISHKLQYKREHEVPVSLRRKLSRLSALFEIADDEFMAIRHTSGILGRALDEKVSGIDLDVEIDMLSVSHFIERSRVVFELCNEASKAGFEFRKSTSPYGCDIDDASQLVRLTRTMGVWKVDHMERVLLAFRDHAQNFFNRLWGHIGRWGVPASWVCELLLIAAGSKYLRVADLAGLGWDCDIARDVLQIARGFMRSNLRELYISGGFVYVQGDGQAQRSTQPKTF